MPASTSLLRCGPAREEGPPPRSLIYRTPESSGVLESCRENGVTIMAYSPLAQGLLTGKYTLDNRPTGPRAGFFTEERIRGVQPLVEVLKAIGEERGKTPAQVALNWCLCQDLCLPIPGAKNARQVEEISGASGWRLEAGELAELDKYSRRMSSLMLGAPFENW